MPFDMLGKVEALTPTNLTIREQARLAQNPNETRWRSHAPTVDADDINISSIETVDFRPAADYRAWNADGREIHEQLGPRLDYEIKPMTATHHIDERRLQKLASPAPEMRALIDRGVIADVNAWPTRLANAIDWGFERAFFQGWCLNTYTVMDPKTGSTVTVARGIAGARYVTEGTAWSGVVDAWARLMFHIGEAQRLFGRPVGGFRIHRSDLAYVIADAPNFGDGTDVNFGNIDTALSQQGFGPIRAVIDDRTFDGYTDGGSAYTAQSVLPQGRVAFFPSNGIVGSTPVVPCVRAYDHVDRDRRVNFRDVVTFYTPQNNGKTLLIEAERIGLPVPSEQFTYVVNVGT
jgi:hypothetical protein